MGGRCILRAYDMDQSKDDQKEIQNLIMEIEEDAKALIKKADKIVPCKYSRSQAKAIRDLQKALRGIEGWDIGIVKNEFGIGIS